MNRYQNTNDGKVHKRKIIDRNKPNLVINPNFLLTSPRFFVSSDQTVLSHNLVSFSMLLKSPKSISFVLPLIRLHSFFLLSCHFSSSPQDFHAKIPIGLLQTSPTAQNKEFKNRVKKGELDNDVRRLRVKWVIR